MKSLPALNQRYIYLLILCISGFAIWVAVKDLFFFDEDVFVTGAGGVFIKNLWQRSGIVKLSFIADHFLWGSSPAGYHRTNLILHLTSAVLAVLVLKQLLKLVATQVSRLQQNAIAYIFFILFLVSPVHSEPLSYILARGGSVVTVFVLLSVLFFLKANNSNKLFMACSWLSFLLALFSYEISWTTPLIILSIIIFSNYFKKDALLKKIWVVIPYFIVFALWFIIKVALINKMVISDYKDDELLGIGLIAMFKNGSVLFLRNFIPPFKSTLAFLLVSISFTMLFLVAMLTLYKNNRTIFYFALLLVVLTVFGFAATVVFGIDSHDSESERYIYCSSVFAIMLLSVVITFLFKSKRALITIVAVISSLYLFTLFKTIKGYNEAGRFANLYLHEVDKKISSGQKLFFVNMPSQYKGALMFRAKSRLAGNTNDKLSVMQEYLSYLYSKNNICVTLSAKELEYVPEKIMVIEKPADSMAVYFPPVNFNPVNSGVAMDTAGTYRFEKGNVIIALKDSALYFFK